MTPDAARVEEEEIRALRERIAAGTASSEDLALVCTCLDHLLTVCDLVQAKSVSIKRLRAMLFGAKTEKRTKGVEHAAKSGTLPRKPGRSLGSPGKRKNKGRLGADDFPAASIIEEPIPGLDAGSACPACMDARLYALKPSRTIRLFGAPAIQAECTHRARLRCAGCQKVFSAAGSERAAVKADSSAKSMICLFKYGVGLPLYRQDQLQSWLGVPLPTSSQFDLIESVFNTVYHVFLVLRKIAADGRILHTDDTGVRILSLMKENRENRVDRKGMFTTGIVSVSGDHRILLFHSGRHHAGENLTALLNHRDQSLPPPIHMADALSRNFSSLHHTLEGKCLTHGRRKYFELFEAFPEQAAYVLYHLSKVYGNDKVARKQNLSPEQRLAFHQKHSTPHMDRIYMWCCICLEEKQAGHNTPLGQAIIYMLRHWEGLTLFLREPGAPLDNSVCERTLMVTLS